MTGTCHLLNARDVIDNRRALMSKSEQSITTIMETVTPSLAEEYLSRNTNNRPMRSQWVDQLAKIIRDGDWQVTHQGIAFNGDGSLKDGQHRLKAIVQAGIPVQILVSRGLANKAMMAIDNNKIRNDADAFQLLGYDYDKAMVAVARRMREGFEMKQDNRMTRPELQRYITEHEEAIRFAKKWSGRKGISNASILAVVGRAWYTANHDRLAQFMECLNSGVNNGPQDTAAIALLRVINNESRSFVSGWGRAILYRKTEAALCAFLEGRPLSKICEVGSERFPLPDETGGLPLVDQATK
jgi:hypothetical protein